MVQVVAHSAYSLPFQEPMNTSWLPATVAITGWAAMTFEQRSAVLGQTAPLLNLTGQPVLAFRLPALDGLIRASSVKPEPAASCRYSVQSFPRVWVWALIPVATTSAPSAPITNANRPRPFIGSGIEEQAGENRVVAGVVVRGDGHRPARGNVDRGGEPIAEVEGTVEVDGPGNRAVVDGDDLAPGRRAAVQRVEVQGTVISAGKREMKLQLGVVENAGGPPALRIRTLQVLGERTAGAPRPARPRIDRQRRVRQRDQVTAGAVPGEQRISARAMVRYP